MPDPLTTLARSVRDLEDARAVALHREADRNRMILHALSTGAPMTTIAEIAGVSRQRVSQLVDQANRKIARRTQHPDQETP